MYQPDRTSDELRDRRRRLLGVFLVGALSLLLLACRLESSLADATTPLAPTRAALRPTFTPHPPDTDTPEATPTPQPSATPPPTDEPPTAVPTRRPTARPRPTNTPPPPTAVPPTPTNTPLPTATVVYQYGYSGKSCTGDDTATSDTVKGKITAADGNVVRNQRVRGSAGPGGEPISDQDAESGGQGNYTVTFQCSNSTACNGDFWVWLVTAGGKQLSPYIKFSFGDGCRRGIVNFTKVQ